MNNKVLVAPSHCREIVDVYGSILTDAGLEMVFPKRHVQMTEEEIFEQLPGNVAVLAGSEPYTARVIEAGAAAGLKVIARAGVGYDGIDIERATRCGIPVTYAPGTNQEAVGEHAMMLFLALARKLVKQHNLMSQGEWPRKAVESVRGKTLGIVGLGRTGKAVATRALAFGMTVIAHDPFIETTWADAHGITMMPYLELLPEADFLSMHVPLTSKTKDMIDGETLGLLHSTAYVVNCSRGGVVNENDLYEALTHKRIAGAALDVFEHEPPTNSPLLSLDNIILTAHTAGIDIQSRNDMATVAAQALVKILAGEWPTEWLVNPELKK